MAVFRIVAQELETGEKKVFWLDNITLKITEDEPVNETPFDIVDITKAGLKTGPFSTIKIQLGLSCNYSCSYCSQSKMEHAEETTKADINNFLEKLEHIPKSKERLKFEFWGGEPFVYWKTLKPLAEAIRKDYPEATFLVITNGSLLTKEIVDWLVELNFGVGLSHDGPGQHMRGDDPLIDNREAVNYAVEKLLPLNCLSISSMLNNENQSRLAIIDYFEKEFPNKFIPSGEMGFVDTYNAGGHESLKFTKYQYFDLRKMLWHELRFVAKTRAHCNSQSMTIEQVAIANREENYIARPIGQKCGMDRHNTIAVDLRGNVLTCQNTSEKSIAPNGESHKIGHIHSLSTVELKTATHWSKRNNCSTCPVLSLCKGSCMFLQDSDFEASCNASFTDMVTQLTIGFEQFTGYIPVFIDDVRIPDDRKDIWGGILNWSEDSSVVKDKKIIPIIPIKS